MKRSFLLILIVLLIASELQANVKVHLLEQQLLRSDDKNSFAHKMKVARCLLHISPVNLKAIEFICENYSFEHKDSIQVFLDSLIAAYPENQNLYVLRANYLPYQIPELDEKELVRNEIAYLCKAYQLDSTDSHINYLLAQAYYRDFIRPYEQKEFGIGLSETTGNRLQSKGIRPSYLPNSGRWALWHFQKVAKYGADSMKLIVYFPMQQLRYFLLGQKPDTLHYPGSLVSKYDYPLWDFAGLTSGWYKHRGKNYLLLMEWVADANYQQTRSLRSIGEPSLSRIKLSKDDETIRFSWFRSFRSDVFVRLDKRGDDYRLYWRETGWSVLQKKDSIRTGWREITQRDFTRMHCCL